MLQVALELAPLAAEAVPAGHAVQVADELAAVAVEYVPEGQAAQAALCCVPPLPVPNVPVGHAPVQLVEPEEPTKVPLGQGVHVDAELAPVAVE